VPYSVVENIFFLSNKIIHSSINTKRYRIAICKISESNRHKLTYEVSIYISNRRNHHRSSSLCDELQAALAIAVWPSHVVRTVCS